MEPLDGIGAIGDLLAGLGALLGVPLAVVGRVLSRLDRDLEPAEIVLVARASGLAARWYAGGDFRERALRRGEAAWLGDVETADAFVSRSRPTRMRLERDNAVAKVCTTIGAVLLVMAALGFVASWLPHLLR